MLRHTPSPLCGSATQNAHCVQGGTQRKRGTSSLYPPTQPERPKERVQRRRGTGRGAGVALSAGPFFPMYYPVAQQVLVWPSKCSCIARCIEGGTVRFLLILVSRLWAAHGALHNEGSLRRGSGTHCMSLTRTVLYGQLCTAPREDANT
ncbi:hypothetical protein NDU88_002990 [Pleurodeles waltl]|uniref:Uncharacterized protein n=1 Tax=Pleurodeles waltl TaxID=8319 RepID=A0AAV7TM99_PLEWA|nr:hypothetical protein NDU88_002990 [Pleurodeles waltl]